MRKNLLLHAIIVVIFLFSGCAKAPEEIGIEEFLEEVEIENCGNGNLDQLEECDFKGMKSCSEYRPDYIGAAFCKGCEIYYLNCRKKDICSEEKCKGKGECKDSEVNEHKIYCECYDNRAGLTCEEGCEEGFHFDFDDSCIPDNLCTQVGCERQNEECVILNAHAVCKCKHPWIGEECEDCSDDYYYFDGECKSKYCSSGELDCGEYEKCFDGNGKPECVCAGRNQNPDDCSECLPDYVWYKEGYIDAKVCINETKVYCKHNDILPENSKEIKNKVTITYTDETGWSEPEYCEWKCNEGYYLENGKCVKT